MTVTYFPKAAQKSNFFLRLLFRWRGSLYKAVWKDLLLWLVLYFSISLTYRCLLSDPQRRTFEQVSLFFESNSSLINLAFLLGFYVNLVVNRWWNQYLSIPWPDRLALFVSSCYDGTDDESRLHRRSIMRYIVLSFVLTMRDICPPVKRRFPTLQEVEEKGLLIPHERAQLETKFKDTNIFWVPMIWAANLVTQARRENKIRDDVSMKEILIQISNFRGSCGMLYAYDNINIPLVYSQVMTLAVYSFFLFSLIGRQLLDPAKNLSGRNVDIYVPVFTILQFVFYMGWLKVAECLVNPFGDDDDDFEINGLVDRNLQVSLQIVDGMMKVPELKKDIFWETGAPSYSRYPGFAGSTSDVGGRNEEDASLLTTVMATVAEDGGEGDGGAGGD